MASSSVLLLLVLLSAPALALFDPFKFLASMTRRSAGRAVSRSRSSAEHAPEMSPIVERTGEGHATVRYPPLVLALLGAQSSHASALNPHAVALRGPFFQGWLLRTVDHARNASVMLIVGSFTCSDRRQHYVFCGAHSASHGPRPLHFECFPPPETVTISGGSPHGESLNLTWAVRGAGRMVLGDDAADVRFAFPHFAISLRARSRRAWAPGNPRAGPEGWLGRTSLLPCRYHVHSLGSACKYTLSAPGMANMSGEGLTHIEGNHGGFFPEGWVWAQGVAAGGACFVLVGGRFVIGGASPLSWVLHVRMPSGATHVFRTTDLCDVAFRVRPQEGRLVVRARALCGRTTVRLSIDSHALALFCPPIHIPTAAGFSNAPGCRETYTACARVQVLERSGRGWTSVENVTFPLTALEFGGVFQSLVSLGALADDQQVSVARPWSSAEASVA